MPVTHFITHQINKEAQKPAAIVTVAATETEVDDYSQLVMSQLKGIFVQRASRRYGCFNPEVTRVKDLTLNWLSGQQNFLSLTKKISQQFADMICNTELEIDGYLAFATEELAETDKLYIFHLREKSNLSLTADMALSESRVLDFSNTGFGLCIDTRALKIEQEEGKRSEEKYVTFSFGRGDKAIQKLFSDFTGFIDTLDTEQETQEFLQIVEEYVQTLPESESAVTKTKVIEYCMEQDKQGEIVAFKTLSGQLDNSEPEKFEQFVAQKKRERRQLRPVSELSINEDAGSAELADSDSTIKAELIPDRKSLKNYLRYSGKNKEVTLSFAATALGTDVSFDASENSLTIKNLPNRLLKQLKPDDS
ncbi:MAG: nucleoid-associated protein [Gammaproteobacteria bacterium]|jgi:nucleoid-associated protein